MAAGRWARPLGALLVVCGGAAVALAVSAPSLPRSLVLALLGFAAVAAGAWLVMRVAGAGARPLDEIRERTRHDEVHL